MTERTREKMAAAARREERERCARHVEARAIAIRDHGPVTPEMPWGGSKESGYGKERSIYSLEEYTEIKHVMVKLPV